MSALELSPIELACGVTLEAVQRSSDRAYVDGSGVIVLDVDTAPALAGAAARAIVGAPVDFLGLNRLGNPLFRSACDACRLERTGACVEHYRWERVA